MLDLVRGLVTILLASRAKLAAENLALRHQLGVLGRSVKRPRLRKQDRIFWVLLSKLWPDWCAGSAIFFGSCASAANLLSLQDLP